MMDGWVSVSRNRPCPICGKPDNCKVSDDDIMVWCGRIDEGSIKQNLGGQYLHRLKDDDVLADRPRAAAPKTAPVVRTIARRDWQSDAVKWFKSPDAVERRNELAELLGVSPIALRALGIGFYSSAWTIPQWDACRKVTGIQRRFRNGAKRHITGSVAGLVFSRDWDRGDGAIFLPEGASDVASLITMGICAVGRPSNTSGVELLIALLQSIPKERMIIVLGENDRKAAESLRRTHQSACLGCSQCGPGRFGAVKTATALSVSLERSIQIAFPPDDAKDVRDWLRSYRQRTLCNSKASGADALSLGKLDVTAGHAFVNQIGLDSINSTLPPVEQEVAPEITLDNWRETLSARRIESVGQPGVYIDRSGTGYGKSFADFAAIQKVIEKDGCALIVVPTHENCEELEEDLTKLGIDAVSYPGRLTEGDDQNCWNADADVAQEMGLSAVATVCPVCPKRRDCESHGYFFDLKRASEATVAIATHNRAIFTSLDSLSAGREFVAIHEDCLSVLRPDCTVDDANLQVARDEVLHRLVNDPKWLNWYGDILKFNDDGTKSESSLWKKRREELRVFAILLIEICEWLLGEMTIQGRTRRLTPQKTLPKAVGIERLLFRATREARNAGHRFSGSVWRLLLAVATGEIDDLGVIVDAPANKFSRRGKANHGNQDELANRQLDHMAL